MSALNLVQSDGRALDPPVGYVGDGWVEADNVRSLDPQLVAAAEQLRADALTATGHSQGQPGKLGHGAGHARGAVQVEN